MGILDKNGQFTEKDTEKIDSFKILFRNLALTIVSFHEVAFSYERDFLIKSLNKCRTQLKEIVENHLSHKSIQRIDLVFDFFTKSSLLDMFFNTNNPESFQLRTRVMSDLAMLMEHAENVDG